MTTACHVHALPFLQRPPIVTVKRTANFPLELNSVHINLVKKHDMMLLGPLNKNPTCNESMGSLSEL